MTVIYIIIAIFLLVLTALLIPLKLELSYTEEFELKLKYAGFKISPKAKVDNEAHKTETKPKDKENFIKKLFNENDFPVFWKKIVDFLNTIFTQLKFILRHLKINKLCTDITVASTDAATTAINYGLVCTAFYNLLKFIESIAKLKLKRINVNSDFEKTKSSFSFSAEILISPLFLLISAVVIFKKYTEFTNREGSALNERK